MPTGVTVGAGVALGTVGPNLAGFTPVDDEGGETALAVSAAWRERNINATMPARASAAMTTTTSHFLG
jgi:hypothetical protein